MPLFGSHGAWQGQERLSTEARHAVTRAEQEGAEQGLRQATADTLLMVLLDEPNGVPVRALAALGTDVVDIQAALSRAGVASVRGDDAERRVALDAAAREAVVLAVNEARRAGFEQAGAGHLLLGVLESRDGVGARALARRRLTAGTLRPLITDLERAVGGDGTALFAAAFDGFLTQVGGDGACPRCAARVHVTFHYCYNCGAILSRQ